LVIGSIATSTLTFGYPRPTLIAQPIEEMTRTAMAALLEQIASDSPPSRRRLLLAPKLSVRDSCGPFEGEHNRRGAEGGHEKG
jgi:DNA-binding LacI/PurR family transcriptional regulator